MSYYNFSGGNFQIASSNFTSNGLLVNDMTGLWPGTGDFTVEFFMKTPSPSQQRVFAIGRYSPEYLSMSLEGGAQVWVNGQRFDFNTLYTDADGGPNLGSWSSWQHIAITRENGTLRVYKNGYKVVDQNNVTFDLNQSYASTNKLLIGGEYNSNYPTVVSFVGSISNFRWITGTSIYSGDKITVPTSTLTAISNTQLLLNGVGDTYDGTTLLSAVDASPAQRTISIIPGVSYSSAAPLPVSPPAANNAPTGDITIVSINGTTNINQELTASSTVVDVDGIGSFSYQWKSSSSSDGVFTNIGGATSSTYTPGSGDIGSYLKVIVTYTDGAGNNESVSSASFGPLSIQASSDLGGSQSLPQVPSSSIENTTDIALNTPVQTTSGSTVYTVQRSVPLSQEIVYDPAPGTNAKVRVTNIPEGVGENLVDSVTIATSPLQADNSYKFVVKAFNIDNLSVSSFASPLQFTVTLPGFTAATTTIVTSASLTNSAPTDTITATRVPSTSDYIFTLSHLTAFSATETSAPGNVPCFPPGVMICTPHGEKAVETLKTGDYVINANGQCVPIRMYSFTVNNATTHNAPYIVPAHALGHNSPKHPLRLSPLHAFQIRPNVWMNPREAAKRTSKLVQYGTGESITYYHIECPNFFRDNLIADGNVVESYGGNQVVNKKGLYKFSPKLNGFIRRAPATEGASLSR